MLSKKLHKLGWKEHNIYKPGTAEYYRDAIDVIGQTICDYDSYNPKNPEHMRKLLGEIIEMAERALKNKKLYMGG